MEFGVARTRYGAVQSVALPHGLKWGSHSGEDGFRQDLGVEEEAAALKGVEVLVKQVPCVSSVNVSHRRP